MVGQHSTDGKGGDEMDKANVINGLEYCKHTDGVECPNCPYWHEDDCVEILLADTLALLKAHDNCENCAVAIEDRQPAVWCVACKYSEPWNEDKWIDVFNDG